MQLHTRLPWADPLHFAAALAAAGRAPEPTEHWALLYSGARASFSGDTSLLALLPERHVVASDFAPLAKLLTADQPRLTNAWFGYLGHELGPPDLTLPAAAAATATSIDAPPLWLTRYRALLVFDHGQRSVELWAADAEAARWVQRLAPADLPARGSSAPPAVTQLASNMDRARYLQGVDHILRQITAGELYQANLTRKFSGETATDIDPLALFVRLHAVSPAPYSCLLRCGSLSLVSSTPERFLRIEADGTVNTRPIKGSAARAEDVTLDVRLGARLVASAKDRAENLMIVDLSRNDLGRSCVTGSVRVDELFRLTTHPTIHHLSSSISGRRRPEVAALDVVRGCFPPGSMTGAPKIAAIRTCAALEASARGAYGGALGWFGGDGSADLAVVIRTIVVRQRRFEFQVGGGIVHDSEPEAELEETMVKARGLAAALGLQLEQLRAL